jgi:HD-like signal output (HDOD) protein
MDAETDTARLANHTVERLRNDMASIAFVGMPEVIRLIQGLASKAFSITIDELAEIIEQDVAVTARVLASANTVGYNPMGMPIYTVSQSIQLIGFDRVRNLAMSMLLAENATTPAAKQEQRDAAAFALASGLFAQSLMETRFGDTERAFICASLRSYGRLMLTAFLLDEYREAEDMFEDLGEDTAFREVFGLTPLEVSSALLQNSQMPRDILRSLQRVPPMLARVSTNKPDDELQVVADFAVKVCDMAMDATVDAELFKLKTAAFIKSYGEGYRFDKDKVQEALRFAAGRYESFGILYKLKRASNNTMRLIAARAEGLNPPEDIELSYVASRHRAAERRMERKSVQAMEARRAAAAKAGRRIDADIVNEAVRALSGMVVVDTPDLKAVHNEVTNALVTALTLDSAILLRRDEYGVFKVVSGAGPASLGLRTAIEQIDASSRDVFGISILRGEDVLVSDARRGNVMRYMPVWLKLNSPVMALIILPIIDNGRVTGLISGLRCRGDAMSLDAATVQALRALRGQISAAWRKVLLPSPKKKD